MGSGSVTGCLLVHLSHKSWDNWGALFTGRNARYMWKNLLRSKKARSNMIPIFELTDDNTLILN